MGECVEVENLPMDAVLGGVMQVDLLSLPPPPKRLKPQWTLRPFDETHSSLERIPFGDEGGGGGNQQPLRCTFHVPESVHLVPSEQPRVMAWDAHKKTWTTEGVHTTVNVILMLPQMGAVNEALDFRWWSITSRQELSDSWPFAQVIALTETLAV